MSNYSSKEGFKQLFVEIKSRLISKTQEYSLPQQAIDHLERVLEYNVPHGKLNRGLTVAQVYQKLNPQASDEQKKHAAVLGWCIEFIQAAFLVSDDIMDASITRRGQPCWYRNKEVGLIAINDALILLSQYQIVLRHYLQQNISAERYLKLDTLLNETVYKTEMGQMLDLSTQPPGREAVKFSVDLGLYTQERYDKIVQYKTAFYSFYAPIALAVLYAERDGKEEMEHVEKIMLKMGHYFQVQDDYLDCYGDESVIGKIGTDIQDAKCSWLVVQALFACNTTQRDVLKEHYGVDEVESIEAVKKVYVELNLKEAYEKYEEKVYAELLEEIQAVKTLPAEVFTTMLDKIYKRLK